MTPSGSGPPGSAGAAAGGALAQLRAERSSLPPALARLADEILGDPGDVPYQSVTELAERARVGEASVIRLCRDLGFKGFQDFKLSLAADLALRARARPTRGDGVDAILDDSLAEAVAALQATRAAQDAGAFERAVAALERAPEVLAFGAGASGVTARDVAYKLLRLGMRVTAYGDAHLAAMAAATLPAGAVMIGVSRSGTTLDTLRALELARGAGATTLLFTQRRRSPAVALADAVLLSASAESPLSGGSIASKMGEMLLLDALFGALLARRADAEAAVAATARAVTDRNV